MKNKELLALLADGEFHSGSELGDLIGVSRTAIWKSLSKLEDEGIKVESHKGKGYRIEGGLELLDLGAIEAGLESEVSESTKIHGLDSVDSTNAYLMSATESGQEYTVCLAERQTAGRGRRGRNWHSPFGKNIYMSIGFELESGAEGLEGLSLIVGYACAQALESLGFADIGLKWPNDIWYEDRKLAGILVELQGEMTSAWKVVVGVGMNVHMESADQSEIDQPWVSLSEIKPVSRNELVSALINSLVRHLSNFKLKGFKEFKEAWAAYDCLFGREVYISGDFVGKAAGIDEKGALIIEQGDETRILNSGEVSVRPAVD